MIVHRSIGDVTEKWMKSLTNIKENYMVRFNGKGSKRRPESTTSIQTNWDKIDWKKK